MFDNGKSSSAVVVDPKRGHFAFFYSISSGESFSLITWEYFLVNRYHWGWWTNIIKLL